MPGKLRFDKVDVADSAVVIQLLEALVLLTHDSASRHVLKVQKRYYFVTPEGPITTEAGWYLICDDTGPLYVGTAENLNARLNTENGSRDQFANPKRTADPERNFIKAFVDSGVLVDLKVVVIPEPKLCEAIGVSSPLTIRDRHNVEKILNLFRGRVVGSQG